MVRSPLFFIFAVVVATVACGNDSTGGSTPPPAPNDSGTGSSSGGGGEAGVEAGAGGDAGGDAAGCPAAASLPAQFRTCVTQSCCGPWTNCSGDPACVAVFQCYEASGCGKPGAAQTCIAGCEADAGATASNEFDALLTCVQQSCSSADAGH